MKICNFSNFKIQIRQLFLKKKNSIFVILTNILKVTLKMEINPHFYDKHEVIFVYFIKKCILLDEKIKVKEQCISLKYKIPKKNI